MQAGQTERVILRKLAATDPDGRRHIIRLLSHFEFRGHLCLVFEPMVRPQSLQKPIIMSSFLWAAARARPAQNLESHTPARTGCSS